jgi:hypothetical protein
MELKINVVEAAARWAEGRTTDKFDDINKIYTKQENGDTIYTDAAQEVFNNEYDAAFSLLLDCKAQPFPNGKLIDTLGLVKRLSDEQVSRTFNRIYEDCSKGVIMDMIWELGELNDLIYTPDAQKVFDEAKDKYLMHLMEFEV